MFLLTGSVNVLGRVEAADQLVGRVHDEFPRLMQLLATRAAGLLNYEGISRDLGIQAKTVSRYISTLEYIYVVLRLPAWHANLGKRLIKREKLQLVDPGLMAHLLNIDAKGPPDTGPLIENFVSSETRKQIGWSAHRGVRIYHFRSTEGQEVDIVLEDRRGNIVAIEVKSASTVTERDLKGLECLKSLTGNRFQCGVVLYAGRQTVPFGSDLSAVPIEALWQVGSPKNSLQA